MYLVRAPPASGAMSNDAEPTRTQRRCRIHGSRRRDWLVNLVVESTALYAVFSWVGNPERDSLGRYYSLQFVQKSWNGEGCYIVIANVNYILMCHRHW